MMGNYKVRLMSGDRQLYVTPDHEEPSWHEAGQTMRDALTYAVANSSGYVYDGDVNDFYLAELSHLYLSDNSGPGERVAADEARAIIRSRSVNHG